MEYSNEKQSPKFIIIPSYPRSGNSWTCQMIKQALSSSNPSQETDIFDVDHLFHTGNIKHLNSCKSEFAIIKTHKKKDEFRKTFPHIFDNSVIKVGLIRSPLDIIVSLYNYLVSSKTIIVPDDYKTNDMKNCETFNKYKERFIESGGYEGFFSIGYGRWDENVMSWNADNNLESNSLPLLYRKLNQDPRDSLSTIGKIGSLGWKDSDINDAIEKVTKDRMRIIYGKWFILKGSSNYYAEYMHPEEIAAAEARFGDTMRIFGL